MQKSKLFMLLLCAAICSNTYAQNVTELHYKTVVIKTNKTSDGSDFWFGKDFLKIQTKPVHDRNPAKYIDPKNNLLICDFEQSNAYLIETLDSVYKTDATLTYDGEKKEINGYHCEKYTLKKTVTFGYTAASGAGSSRTVDYDMTVWITNDLKVDESYNTYISHTLFTLIATFPFKGVIVKMEGTSSLPTKYDGYLILDKAVTAAEPEKDFVRPWLKYKDPVALLPGESNSYAVTENYTQEKTTDKYKRMKALLIKTTGIEKPKFKTGFAGIIF